MALLTRRIEVPITWGQIKQWTAGGQVNDYLKVGDEVAETLETGEKVVFVVAGISVYAENEVIFSLKDCLADEHCMNSEWTNKGGWPECDMRRHVNEDVFTALPAELRSVIWPRAFGQGKEQFTDKLWLFSEVELFGENRYGKDSGDKHIPYYRNPINRCKGIGIGGEADWWWERSPLASSSTGFCVVTSGGGASSYASYTSGVCFGFCI